MDNKLLLEYAAFSGDWSVIRGNITLEDLDIFREKGGNLLETLGGNGNILKLPPFLIGEEGLLYKDKELSIKTIQLLTENDSLSMVPKKYLTKENLCAKNPKFGYTTFHYAARHGCLNDIPKYFHSEQNFMAKANKEQTPLELAVGMIIALRKYEDNNVQDKVKKIKQGINLILIHLRDKTLQAIKTWYVDKEILGYINNEINKRHVIKSLQKEEQNIEI
jgi:hypothetical protein